MNQAPYSHVAAALLDDIQALAKEDLENTPSMRLAKTMKDELVAAGLQPHLASRLVLLAKIKVARDIPDSQLRQLAQHGAVLFIRTVRAAVSSFPELTPAEVISLVGPQLSLTLDLT